MVCSNNVDAEIPYLVSVDIAPTLFRLPGERFDHYALVPKLDFTDLLAYFGSIVKLEEGKLHGWS